MGHHLHSFVGHADVLRRLSPALPGLRLLALPQQLWLAPATSEMLASEDDEPFGPAGIYVLSARLARVAAELSQNGPLAWLETDWFGGVGSSFALLWREMRCEEVGDVNTMLKMLGVQHVQPPPEPGLMGALVHYFAPPRPLDEWDSVGLGSWRSAERAWEAATPVQGF